MSVVKINFSATHIRQIKLLTQNVFKDCRSVSQMVERIFEIGFTILPERYFDEKFAKVHHCTISNENFEKIKELANKYQTTYSQTAEIIISGVLSDILKYATLNEINEIE